MAEKSDCKELMKKAVHHGNDLHIALLDFRNTTRADAIGSPAQLLMGRQTKHYFPVQVHCSNQKLLIQVLSKGNLLLAKHNRKFTMTDTQDLYLNCW